MTFGAAQQARELSEAQAVVWVAEPSGAGMVGYAQLAPTAAPACIVAAHPIELQRLYVDATWHGAGVGAALLEASFTSARERGHDLLWLGVWEKNPRARAFYARHGFRTVGSHLFQLGSDAQTDLLLARAP